MYVYAIYVSCVVKLRTSSGNSLIMASSISCMLAITWGGVQFAWTSPRTMVPLIIGVIGLALSLVYEAWIPSQPSVGTIYILLKRSNR